MARAEVKELLNFLTRRQLPITARQRQEICECADLTTLARWLGRMGTVTSVDELLASP
ncbi:MAG TPA: hypothetical protein VF516_23950 [Kofleriaceae bacterium]